MKRWINTIGIELIWVIVFATFKGFTTQYRIPGIIGPLCDGLFLIGLLFAVAGLVTAFVNMFNCYIIRFFGYLMMVKLQGLAEDEEKMDYPEFCDMTDYNEKNSPFLQFKWRMVIVGIASVALSFLLVSLFYKV